MNVRAAHAEPVFERIPEAEAGSLPGGAGRDGAASEIATIAKLARHIRDHSPERGGFRTLIVGENGSIDASEEALAMADELARDGLQTIVVDWSLDEDGFCRGIGLATKPGFTDLARGDARFEDVIRSLPDGRVHLIACGSAVTGRASEEVLDPDKLNLLLDALDEAYDQIVVVARDGDARVLFETIQGRFDAGVTVASGRRQTVGVQDPPGTFLGFEVTEIVLVRFLRAEGKASGTQRLQRRGLPGDIVVRPA